MPLPLTKEACHVLPSGWHIRQIYLFSLSRYWWRTGLPNYQCWHYQIGGMEVKKYLLIGIALASFAAATANAHVYHNWQLVSKRGGIKIRPCASGCVGTL